MPIDPWAVLAAGGKPSLDLLDFCVLSARLEIVVAWLIADFRNRPTAERALAIYDVFLAPGAPARIRADAVLPPRELLLADQVAGVRRRLDEVTAHNAEHPDAKRPPSLPPRVLFDTVHAALTAADFEPVRAIAETYDPARRPAENLAGGRLSEGQRAFVERTWRMRIRPALVRAGFHRISSIGG
jgi:hypothetical protein